MVFPKFILSVVGLGSIWFGFSSASISCYSGSLSDDLTLDQVVVCDMLISCSLKGMSYNTYIVVLYIVCIVTLYLQYM